MSTEGGTATKGLESFRGEAFMPQDLDSHFVYACHEGMEEEIFPKYSEQPDTFDQLTYGHFSLDHEGRFLRICKTLNCPYQHLCDLTGADNCASPTHHNTETSEEGFHVLSGCGLPKDIQFECGEERGTNFSGILTATSTNDVSWHYGYGPPVLDPVWPSRHGGLLNEIQAGLDVESRDHEPVKETLVEYESKYRLLLDNSPLGILLANTEGQILEISSSLEKIIDFRGLDEIKSSNVFTFPWMAEAGISEGIRTCMDQGKLISLEAPHTSAWGKQNFLNIIVVPKFSKDGKVEGCLVVIEDITVRRRAEQALREREARFQRLLEHAAVAVSRVQINSGRFITFNNRFCDIFGYTRSEMENLTFQEITHQEDLKHF